ncbi:MAG TPA: phage antirepressor N-terminal domain-containing protein [Herpetosiphonaceae bacterium]|nr:phage antirepressor N-terminal domain-containing protein [Herpetosiphonaceae bacterium]
MSEDAKRQPARLARFEEVRFDNDQLLAVILEGDGVAVPVRTICQALGLDIDSQSAKLREHEVLSQGLRVVRVPRGRQLTSVVAILHKYIPFWLATIVPGQVKAAARPKLIRYQIELVDILAALYGGELRMALPVTADATLAALQQRVADALLEVRLAREALLASQQRTEEQLQSHEVRIGAVEGLMDELQQQLASHTTITGPQQEVIKRAIQRIATRYKRRTGQEIYGKLFAQFCIDMGTPKYALLPAGKYDAALTWLRERAAELLPDDADALPPLQEKLL